MTKKTHPATFTPAILDAINSLLGDAALVLDPFAGVGGIHALQKGGNRLTIGVEVEPEWAAASPYTYCGSALALPFANESFDAIATSPTYGNRMADTYDGRDGSRRATYRIALGRPLSEDNSGGLQWGREYREFHESAWAEAVRVLRPEGRFVLNIKDHIRDGVVQRVADWHVSALEYLGLDLVERLKVKSPGFRMGRNHDKRVDYEEVILLIKGAE